jgi:hypothetical protein
MREPKTSGLHRQCRFRQSLENLAQAMNFVPEVHLFHNSSSLLPYRLVLTVRNGKTEFSTDPARTWLAFLNAR